MTTPTGQTERTVRELDNDLQSIYEMFAGIEATQRRHGNRLEEIDRRLADVDGRLGEMDGKLGLLER